MPSASATPPPNGSTTPSTGPSSRRPPTSCRRSRRAPIVPVVLAESDAQGTNRNITVIEPLVGGMGAYLGHDGVDTRDNSAANLSNHPLETIEEDIGVIIRRYDIRPDSGGAGRWRGGTGQVLSMEILKEGGKVLARGMERMRFPSWGYGGAKPAHRMRAVLNLGRADEKELGKNRRAAGQGGATPSPSCRRAAAATAIPISAKRKRSGATSRRASSAARRRRPITVSW